MSAKRKKRKGSLPDVIQSKYDDHKRDGKKKKLLYHSDFSLLRTGFGCAAKLILSHLYNTGKYDIVHFCCGMTDPHQDYERVPWKSIGALPADAHTSQALNRDPKLAQMASYGANTIDEVMAKEKPDVYIGVQDIWGCDFALRKSWFTKDNMAIWTTLDSLPILPMAVEAAKNSKNFWCWSEFATKGLHKLGHDHVKTLHGPLDESNYYRLDDETRLRNRKLFNISEDAFIVGFVFRNQLRKSVPNLLEGYRKFLDQNPELQKEGASKLLLHTNFSEGWNIHKLAKEYNIKEEDILTTYVCGKCGSYGIHPYVGQGQKCPHCHEDKTYNTTGIGYGATEAQLNEVYNFMDVYCHPFTSGGQEIPIQEAKLTELITLVTNYSCGEDSCNEDACSLPLEWSEYREHGTEFIKASTSPDSIAKQLKVVYEMSSEEKERMGKTARQWVIDNFSISNIGKQMEEFIDSRPFIDKDKVYDIEERRDPSAIIDKSLPDKQWLISMYDKILDMRVDDKDEGYKYWIQELNKGVPRLDVERFFRGTARKEIKEQKKDYDEAFDVAEKGKKLLYVIPESAGDVYMATSLFESISKQYPDYKLYVATKSQFRNIVEGHPLVHKVIEYDPIMEDIHFMEGWGNRGKLENQNIDLEAEGNHNGFFDICFLSYVNAQRISCYTHNGLDKIMFDIKK